MAGISFEVESVYEIHGRAYVLARVLCPKPFRVEADSVLGGSPLLGWLEQPRATHPNGSPRLDLFTFILRQRSDLERFHPGQVVWLEGLS